MGKLLPKLILNIFSKTLGNGYFNQNLIKIFLLVLNQELKRLVIFIILVFPFDFELFKSIKTFLEETLIPFESRVQMMQGVDCIFIEGIVRKYFNIAINEIILETNWMAMVVVEEKGILIDLIVKELVVEFDVRLSGLFGECAILVIGLHVRNYQNIL